MSNPDTKKNTSIYSWKNGDIISRLFYINEMTKQTPRVIAINYVRNMKTGETTYGASIYRKNSHEPVLKKDAIYKMLRETAHTRLQTRPVTGLQFPNLATLHKDLRKALFSNSVAGKKLNKQVNRNGNSSETSSNQAPNGNGDVSSETSSNQAPNENGDSSENSPNQAAPSLLNLVSH
jgi:hypothetical protein